MNRSKKMMLILGVSIFLLLALVSCGVNGGNAVTSSGSGPVPTISADCNGNSCM